MFRDPPPILFPYLNNSPDRASSYAFPSRGVGGYHHLLTYYVLFHHSSFSCSASFFRCPLLVVRLPSRGRTTNNYELTTSSSVSSTFLKLTFTASLLTRITGRKPQRPLSPSMVFTNMGSSFTVNTSP